MNLLDHCPIYSCTGSHYCDLWQHDTQHKGNISDIQHNDTQHNDTQHNDTAIMLNVIVLSVGFYLLIC